MSDKILKSGLFLLIIGALLILFQTQLYRLTPDSSISEQNKKLLLNEAAVALSTLDVPVGALVIYEGKIIGKGHNTVKSEKNLAGHAEINALNDALHLLGIEKFNQLNRDKLMLVTSFEPCEMCRGTIEIYRIKHVVFLKNKPLTTWWKKQWNGLKYEFWKRQSPGGTLQDSLFYLHPEYPGKK